LRLHINLGVAQVLLQIHFYLSIVCLVFANNLLQKFVIISSFPDAETVLFLQTFFENALCVHENQSQNGIMTTNVTENIRIVQFFKNVQIIQP